jgi:asparagine synthase (glutamine-hydrolysing)
MANSVELRSPFLDYRLVETALGSKNNLLSYSKGTKYWFKKAMVDTLPIEVLERPKQGFTPPVREWLIGVINKYSYLLYNGFLVESGILHPLKARLIFLYKNPITAYGLYQLILLEIWGREYVWEQKPEEIK